MRWILTSAAAWLCVAGGPAGAGQSGVADAVMSGDRTAVRALLQKKADVNAAQVDGATALHWAVHRDDLEMADLLIRAGAQRRRRESPRGDAAGDGVALRERRDGEATARGGRGREADRTQRRNDC